MPKLENLHVLIPSIETTETLLIEAVEMPSTKTMKILSTETIKITSKTVEFRNHSLSVSDLATGF
jgi:hypothetical protein